MNERSRTVSGNPPQQLHRARPAIAHAASAPPYQSSQPTSTRDRANLFRSHLTRRPTGSTTTSSAAGSGAAAAGKTGAVQAAAEAARLAAEEEQCEIVVRNQNGDIDLEGAPVVSFDDIDEMALEARQETERKFMVTV